jgi:hypothetical protein
MTYICRPGPNPTKNDFFQFYTYFIIFFTNMGKISLKFVKNAFYQIFTNNCKPNFAYLYYKYSSKNWLKMLAKNLSYQTTYIDCKQQKCKMCKLQIFVTFGRMGT